MDLEHNDSLKATKFSVKFIAFKTPTSYEHALPRNLFFTFKFFSFQASQTEAVTLLNKSAATGLSEV